MTFDDLDIDFFNLLDIDDKAKAEAYLKSNARYMQMISDSAFRQVVYSVLVLASLVSEEDLADAIKSCESSLLSQMADKLVESIAEIKAMANDDQDDEKNDAEDDNSIKVTVCKSNKKIYEA